MAQDNHSIGINNTSSHGIEYVSLLDKLDSQIAETRFIVLKILMPIFVTFGVTGNIVNVAVLTRRWMRSSTNYYLTALAICDINYLIFAFTLLWSYYDNQLKDNLVYMKYVSHVGVPLVNVFSNTGVWLTLTFTIERYIGVCYPMKGKIWCTPQRAKYIILVVVISAGILTLPNFFARQVVVSYTGNTSIVQSKPTSFGTHEYYTLGYTWINQSLFTFIPVILLSIFNSLLIHTVTTASKNRRRMTTVTMIQTDRQKRQNEQNKITRMLIAVVIVFLICQLPQAISNLYQECLTFKGMFTDVPQKRMLIVGNVCNLLVVINSSVNFVLYSSLSLKFRRTFHVLFCNCLWRQNRPNTLIYSGFFSQAEHRADVKQSKSISSPYTSSPVRHANSYLSINDSTPGSSPKPSLKGYFNTFGKKLRKTNNGYLSVNVNCSREDELKDKISCV